MKIAHKQETILKELPPPLSSFSEGAKAAYQEWGKKMIDAGILKVLHIPVLQIFADNYSQWETAINYIHKMNAEGEGGMEGYIQTFKTGASNISPAVNLKEKAEKQMFICIARLGMDPKSETAIKGKQEDKDPISLDQILNKKTSVSS